MQAQTNSEKITCFSPFFWVVEHSRRSVEARKNGGKQRGGCTDKKENQIFLIYSIRKFRMEQLQSHI
jgi:hypothetical protein